MCDEGSLFILVALTVKQTQILMSCNDKPCFGMGLSADYYTLLSMFCAD